MRTITISLMLFCLTALPSLAAGGGKLPPPHVTEIDIMNYTAESLGWCIYASWQHVPGSDDYYIFIRGKKGLAPRPDDGSKPDEARWKPRQSFNNVQGHHSSVSICDLDQQQKVKFRLRAVDSSASDPLKSGESTSAFVFRLPKYSKAHYHPMYGVPGITIYNSAW